MPSASGEADGTVQLNLALSTTAAHDGPLTVVFSGRDRAGNTVSATWSATVDNTPPVPVIVTSVGPDAWTKDPVTVTVMGGDANVVLPVDVRLNNAPFFDAVVVGEGDYRVTATATDRAGTRRV